MAKPIKSYADATHQTGKRAARPFDNISPGMRQLFNLLNPELSPKQGEQQRSKRLKAVTDEPIDDMQDRQPEERFTQMSSQSNEGRDDGDRVRCSLGLDNSPSSVGSVKSARRFQVASVPLQKEKPEAPPTKSFAAELYEEYSSLYKAIHMKEEEVKTTILPGVGEYTDKINELTDAREEEISILKTKAFKRLYNIQQNLNDMHEAFKAKAEVEIRQFREWLVAQTDKLEREHRERMAHVESKYAEVNTQMQHAERNIAGAYDQLEALSTIADKMPGVESRLMHAHRPPDYRSRRY